MWVVIEIRERICVERSRDCSNPFESMWEQEYQNCLNGLGPSKQDEPCTGAGFDCGAGLCCGEASIVGEDHEMVESVKVCNVKTSNEWIDPADWEGLYEFHCLEEASKLGASVLLLAAAFYY